MRSGMVESLSIYVLLSMPYIYAMRITRHFTESVKKQIASRQRWCCSACESLLDSTYQVDHTIALCDGGEDSVANATAMCPNCHARKTQRENIERRERLMLARLKQRERFEKRVRDEEDSLRVTKERNDGSSYCTECDDAYYPLFPHHCTEVSRRVDARLGARPVVKKQRVTLFEEFYFIKPCCL